MIDPTLAIVISAAGLPGDLDDLAFSGAADSVQRGIVGFQEPGSIPQIRRSPSASNQDGDGVPLEFGYQDVLLGWDFTTDKAASETASRALIATVRLFLARVTYTTTITVVGAPAETWECRTGSLTPANPRSYPDLANSNPVWSISIPAHPVRSVA